MKYNYDRHVLHDFRIVHNRTKRYTLDKPLCGTPMPTSVPLRLVAELIITISSFLPCEAFGDVISAKAQGYGFNRLTG